MAKITTTEKKHTTYSCSSCDSTFTISYEEEDVEGEIEFCPFCGAEIDDDDEDDFTGVELNDDDEESDEDDDEDGRY